MKNTLYTLVVATGLMFVGIAQARAEVISNPSTDTSQDAVAALVVLVPVVTNNPSTDAAQDGAAGITSDPSSDLAQDGPAGITSNPSTDLDQDGPGTATPPGDNGNGGNGSGNNNSGGSTSGSSSSSSSSSSSGGSALISGFIPTVLGAATTGCPLITDYLKFGGPNDPIQVSKLQIFLKGSEGADVIVNGTFEERTENAVRSFQKKYLSDILGPWDATRPTGFVYITTTKKINELACAQPITLSAEERAIIEAYKARGSVDSTDGSVEVGATISTTTVGTLDVDTATDTDDANVAAAANASVMSRFWDFIKSLFQ